jgi:hypothetical protein
MSRVKQYTRLVDSTTGELMVSADLTPASVKRFIKHYQQFGFYLIQQ